MNALVTLWWAFTQDPPNELYIVANDFEQAQARVFRTIAGLIAHNPALTPSATVNNRQITLSNGTVIRAIASEYAGAAGSNHGCTSWDELWGYTTEPLRRLWEELTPVPTRPNSIRIITSYAGYEGESDLLWSLYRQGVDIAEHPDGRGHRLHPDLPLYTNPDARLFVYWDHEPRLPWQTPAYYATQRRTLRPATYLRQHENRWAPMSSRFITSELWDHCVTPDLTPLLPSRDHQLFVGVDVGIRHDAAAVVAVYRDGDHIVLASHSIWTPSATDPLDIEATIETRLPELHNRYRVKRILCDPYQCHRTITSLQRAGLPHHRVPPNHGQHDPDGPDPVRSAQRAEPLPLPLRRAARPGPAYRGRREPRGWRLAKEKASHKVDAIVALALAATAAVDAPPPQDFSDFHMTVDNDFGGLGPGETWLS